MTMRLRIPKTKSLPSVVSVCLLGLFAVTSGCVHPDSGNGSRFARSKVEIERPENNGLVNIVLCTVTISDGQTRILSGGDQAVVSVRSGTFWVMASSGNPYPYGSKEWRSPRVKLHANPGETLRLSVWPRSRGSTYVGGWNIRVGPVSETEN